jgi:hypothetical protein
MMLAVFEPHVGTSFDVAFNGQIVPLTLILAAAKEGSKGAPMGVKLREVAFQLQFLEQPGWSLPQYSHQLTHPVLGKLEIFLVPIGPNREGTGFLYQAIFT